MNHSVPSDEELAAMPQVEMIALIRDLQSARDHALNQYLAASRRIGGIDKTIDEWRVRVRDLQADIDRMRSDHLPCN